MLLSSQQQWEIYKLLKIFKNKEYKNLKTMQNKEAKTVGKNETI